jgi:hypothetical protein
VSNNNEKPNRQQRRRAASHADGKTGSSDSGATFEYRGDRVTAALRGLDPALHKDASVIFDMLDQSTAGIDVAVVVMRGWMTDFVAATKLMDRGAKQCAILISRSERGLRTDVCRLDVEHVKVAPPEDPGVGRPN